MHDEATEAHDSHGHGRPADQPRDAVWWATLVGVGFASVALIAGLMTALARKVADCPDGKYFPEGTTDFTCYVHPQAGPGVAIAALSVVLGILLVFSSMVIRANTEAPTSSS